jgi:hypothetical protein
MDNYVWMQHIILCRLYDERVFFVLEKREGHREKSTLQSDRSIDCLLHCLLSSIDKITSQRFFNTDQLCDNLKVEGFGVNQLHRI